MRSSTVNFQPLARRVNRHDVKAHLDFVRAITRRKNFRRTPHPLLLALIDGLFRRTRRAASPGFHLDEDQSVAIDRNEIDFRSGRPKIPRHDSVAVAPQMLFRRALAAAAKRKPRSKGSQPRPGPVDRLSRLHLIQRAPTLARLEARVDRRKRIGSRWLLFGFHPGLGMI